MCPRERNTLKEIYDAAKGNEWTVDSGWTSAYDSHCDWFGVQCNNDQQVIKLELHSNGLSGVLSESIGNLSLLEALDLSDNDIKARLDISLILYSYVLTWILRCLIPCFYTFLHIVSREVSPQKLANLLI